MTTILGPSGRSRLLGGTAVASALEKRRWSETVSRRGVFHDPRDARRFALLPMILDRRTASPGPGGRTVARQGREP